MYEWMYMRVQYFCILIGLVAGMLIGKFTEYFTSFDFAPVISIKDRGVTGPATVVIQVRMGTTKYTSICLESSHLQTSQHLRW